MKISCLDSDVGTLLRSYYFVVPRFQRPYSWEREQVEEFWEDAMADSDSDHFIGSLVLYKLSSATRGVVDGQQRLTTITLVLCALRNSLRALKLDEPAQGLQKLVERRDIEDKPQFVVQTESSYPYLQGHIQSYNFPEEMVASVREEQRLKEAFDFFTAQIDSVAGSATRDASIPKHKRVAAAKQKLLDVRDRFLNIKVIHIELESEDDAYFIFETLNTRGKDLRVSDLVKNHLLRLAKPSSAATPDLQKDRWAELAKVFEGSSVDIQIDSFLLHFWLSKYDYTSAKKLFKAIRKQVRKRSEATEFMRTLILEARQYRVINEPSVGRWRAFESRMRGALDALALFRVKQALPMVMALMRAYKDKRIKHRTTTAALRAIENFHFAFTAVTSQRSSGGISQMYANHARLLDAASSAQEAAEAIQGLVDKLKAKVPPYAEFEANFETIRYSRTYTKQRALVHYILSRLDDHHRTAGVSVDYASMTIEHLAPENPKETDGDAPEDDAVASLGNLLLVDQQLNSRLKNKSFHDKKPILLKSGVWVDDGIRDASTWRDTQIRERTRAMSKLAYDEVWKVTH